MSIPDSEKLIGGYLRGTITSTRVVGKTPDDKSTSWVRLTQLGATNDAAVTPDYLITYLLQLECYAGATGGQPEAIGLGGTIRAALDALKNGRGTLIAGGGSATVSNVRFGAHARIPDTDFEPARERVVLDAFVTMHEGH